MSASNITNLSPEQLKSRLEDKQVILFYPWSSYKNVFLAHFLQDSSLFYFRPMGSAIPLNDWLQCLADELESGTGTPAQNLRDALENGTAARLGEALAADLTSSKTVFFDEFDRINADSHLEAFIQSFVAALPAGTQLVVNSRSFDLEVWHSIVASGKACVLGVETRPNDVMFATEDTVRPQLEVYAFGRGHVFVNGREITQWDGALPRNLFFYFMDHPMVTRDEIFEVFWPNLSIKEATNVFHVTKRKISERISTSFDEPNNYELTSYKTGFYIPSEKVRRHYDVGEFQNAIEQAMIATSDDREKAMLTRAISLYRDEFLTTVSMDWSDDRRAQLKQSYAQALINMARLQQRKNEWQAALGYFARALKETPEREDIHREIMNIYLQQEMYDDAARQYQALEATVTETLQITPDRESQALYERVQAQR